jgi:hypothetical protein
MRGISLILKTGRLVHIHIFGQETMKESIADINLMETPSTRHCKGENQSHCGWLDDWTERITIVDAMPLSEAPSDKSGLMFINRTIRPLFGLKNPLASDNVNAGRSRNQDPCPGMMKCSHLISHGSPPCSLAKRIAMRHGRGKESTPANVITDSTISVCLLSTSVVAGAGDHGVS